MVEGEEEDLEWVRSVLEAKYIVKVRGIMGPEERDKKRIEILVRAVEWRIEELSWEADPRHVERILEDMEMDLLCLEGSCRKQTEMTMSSEA